MIIAFKLSTIKPGIRAVVLPDGSTPYLVLSNWSVDCGTWYVVVKFSQEVIDDANPTFDWGQRQVRFTSQYATHMNSLWRTNSPEFPWRTFGTLKRARKCITEVLTQTTGGEK